MPQEVACPQTQLRPCGSVPATFSTFLASASPSVKLGPTTAVSRVGWEFTSSKTQKKDKGGSGWDQDRDAVSFDRTLTLSSSQPEAHRAGAGLRVKACHGGHRRPPPAGGRLVAAAGEPHGGREDPGCPELTPLPSPSWPHRPGMQSKAGRLPGGGSAGLPSPTPSTSTLLEP